MLPYRVLRVGVVELVRTEPSFRRLWLSQVVSEVGDWFQFVAIAAMFPTREGGAAIVAGLIVARHLVAALTSPIAGVVADRYNRGRVMIAADLARMVVTLGFLLVRGPQDVVLVFALSIVIGSMLGGATAALVGLKAAFALNAASFALSALFVWRAKVPDGASAAGTEAPAFAPLRDMRDGATYLRDHPAQRSLLMLKAGALLSGGVFVLVAVFADEIFASPSSIFGQKSILMGLLLTGRGLGALVMPFVFARLLGSHVRGVARAVLVAFPMCVVFFAVFSQAPAVGVAMLALFFAHGATSTVWVGSSQLLQVTVPNRVLGRVLSVDLALVTISVAIVNSIIATVLHHHAPPRLVALGLALAFLLPLAGWLYAYAKHLPTLELANTSEENEPSRPGSGT